MIIPSGTSTAANPRGAWPLISAMPPMGPFDSVPAIARAQVGVTLTSWRLSPLMDAAQSVISELTANAVQASRDDDGYPRWVDGGKRLPVVMPRLSSDGHRLLVECWDMGSWPAGAPRGQRICRGRARAADGRGPDRRPVGLDGANAR
jgi:hypothetical protein